MGNVEKRLSEIEARLDAATPGPWEICKDDRYENIWAIGPILGYDYDALEIDEDDALFVSRARDDIPWLVGKLRCALQEADAYCHAYNELVDMIGLCSCDPIWTGRGLHGPHCMWNNAGVKEINEELTAALAAMCPQHCDAKEEE